MNTVSSDKMKRVDKYCIDVLGISGMILMENAAIKVFNEINKSLKEIKDKKIAIFSGVGNNGGDGLAIARHCYLNGYDVQVLIIGDLNKASNDFGENFEIIKNINKIDNDKIKLEFIRSFKDLTKLESLSDIDVVVDSIFGTGLKRNVEGIYKETILKINSLGACVFAVDVPSGINSDNGRVMGEAVKAKETITLQIMKEGFLNGNILEYLGEIKVVDIGIPKKVIELV